MKTINLETRVVDGDVELKLHNATIVLPPSSAVELAIEILRTTAEALTTRLDKGE